VQAPELSPYGSAVQDGVQIGVQGAVQTEKPQNSPDHCSGDDAKKPHRSYKRVDFTLSQRVQKR
jgi:hypothetical protein